MASASGGDGAQVHGEGGIAPDGGWGVSSGPPSKRSPRPNRIALYHRVSTLDQNPELAESELREFAARIGGEVVLNVQETASGAMNNRPGLLRVMEAAKRGQVDVVVVWKLDRFGRSALDLLANIRSMEDSGVRFVALTQGIDIRPGGDAMSRLLLTMLAAIAEFERDLIRDRTMLGLEKARQNGKKLGRPRVNGPSREAVERLRGQGLSWALVADELGCTVATARRRAKETTNDAAR